MSKYAPLTDYLNQHQGERWRVRFSEVERVLGFELPNSARKYPAWWANDARQGRQCMAWISVGWMTQDLDLGSEAVTFCRTDRVRMVAPPSPQTERAQRKRSFNAMPDRPILKTIPDGSVEISIRMQWSTLGEVRLDSSGALSFPTAARAPGLYRLRLIDAGGEKRYIGETVDLQRRFQHYRTPGPTQATNIRINVILLTHLNRGDQVEIDIIVDDMHMIVEGRPRVADLSDKATRRLFEHAAIVVEHGLEIGSLNR